MASETNNGDTETKKRDVWTSKEMEILGNTVRPLHH